ncbi:MAG TPA: sn-glycerol-3-phosphate ABC transporter ATP-binding protein UgpC [Gaiellaceae bacterium]|nr:sn-glycerol-3-phosphate ABC transporter ATP-binding protein UgpC [Gaiellaceae bacterium]
MADIVLEELSKRFPNGFEAVKRLSLAIGESELLVLVGPSGCGKTTALRMIAGLEDITSGELFIGGRRMNDVLERDRDIAMVFQNYALYPHMTVAQNIAFSLRLGKVPKHEIRERVRETATLLGLEGLLDRRPKQLSGGQKQRVAMGRAIVRQPQVFLMDEPLSNLDAQLRVQMRGEIEALQKRLGVTTVYVTHDQVEALTMGDRIAVLRDGELQQVGGPAEVYDRPANLFVAGFIGSPPMNLAHGTVEANGATAIRLGATTLPVPDEVAREHGLDAYRGRRVIVGVRPEDLHGPESGNGHGPARLPAAIDRVESVGASLLVHFAVDAPDAKSAALAAMTGGEALEATQLAGGAGSSFCASFEPRSGIRVGDALEVAVDTARLHFFDPETERTTRPSSP